MQDNYLRNLFFILRIPDSVIPFTRILLSRMDEKRIVFLNSSLKEEIMETCNIGNARIRQLSIILKEKNLLVSTPDKWVFQVSELLLSPSFNIKKISLEDLNRETYKLSVTGSAEERKFLIKKRN